MGFWLSLATICEIVFLTLAVFLIFRGTQHTVAEAATYAIVIVLMGLSFIFQVVFLVGFPKISFIVESILVILAIAVILRKRHCLIRDGIYVGQFIKQTPIAVVFFIACLYLFLLGWLIPPNFGDSLRYHLARVFLFQQDHTLFLNVVSPHQAHRAVFPVGSDILTHIFLRFYTDYGVAIFSFMAYLGIGLGTYALARYYTSRPVAISASMVIISMPEVVYQATSTSNDIIIAFVAVFCILVAHSIYDQPKVRDILLVTLGLTFGIAVKTLFFGFLIPFVVLLSIVMIRRYGFPTLKKALSHFKWAYILALIPILVFSQVWLFVHNFLFAGGWLGPPDFVRDHRNLDGLLGAIANLVRYFFQSLDILRVTNLAIDSFFGFSPSQILTSFYYSVFYPLWGNAGTTKPFEIGLSIGEGKSWFGPLSFLLVLPALWYSIIRRGPSLLRALALTLLGYVGLLAWQLRWTPWNNRFFTLFFVSAGACLAFFFSNWKNSTRLLCAVNLISGFLIVYGCVFNGGKPIFPLEKSPSQFIQGLLSDNIWVKSNFGLDRYYFWGDPAALSNFPSSVPDQENIGVVIDDTASFYYFKLIRPDLRFTMLSPGIVSDGIITSAEIGKLDYLLCIGLDKCSTLLWEKVEFSQMCYSQNECLYHKLLP